MRRLPVSLIRETDETTDSYVERVADANHLSTLWLSQHLLDTGVATTERPSRPGPSFPSGWQIGAIEQVCPRCLHETGAWAQHWRDPMVCCCIRHGLYLVDRCPGCDRPVREGRHGRLRPTGYTTSCGNALGTGRSARCTTSLADLQSGDASPEVLDQQAYYAAHADAPTVLATSQHGDRYRESLRSLTVLLLHLTDIEASTPVRWSLRVPGRRMRAKVLLEAHRVITSPTVDAALGAFHPWFDQIPPSAEGATAWALDRSIPNPAITRLVLGAASTRQRLSHRLQHHNTWPLPSLPQVLPRHLAHLVSGVGLSGATGRGFAPLCLAKARLGPGGTWSSAGQLLGVDESSGTALARTASSHLTCSVDTWMALLEVVATRLRQDGVNYQERARVVRALSGRPDLVIDILRETRPGTRDTSARYALTWLAEEWACLAPQRAPGDRRERALYLQFRASLTRSHQLALANCATYRTGRTQPAHPR